MEGSLKDEGYGGIEPLKYDLQSNCTTLYFISLVYYTLVVNVSLIKNMYMADVTHMFLTDLVWNLRY